MEFSGSRTILTMYTCNLCTYLCECSLPETLSQKAVGAQSSELHQTHAGSACKIAEERTAMICSNVNATRRMTAHLSSALGAVQYHFVEWRLGPRNQLV